MTQPVGIIHVERGRYLTGEGDAVTGDETGNTRFTAQQGRIEADG